MKTRSRFLLIALSCLLSLAMLTVAIPALAAPPAEKLSDEVSRNTTEITLPDGRETGVLWSEIMMSGATYGENRAVNVVEFDLANTNLSVEVLNSGRYMVDAKNLDTAARDYNTSHNGQTVLAAINGDLWMTSAHSGSSVTSAVLKVSRGVLIIDGEIWASQQIDQENLGATNAENGLPAGNRAAFGVTSENQPLVGSPDVRITMRAGSKTIRADGLNRLPANNSLIVYNHRVNSSNYALNDAYEVVLKVDESSAFKANGSLTATVTAIYEPGATERPAIEEDVILLTARGSRINDLKNNFKVGDEISFKTSISDRMGRTALWQDVQEAIGGHMEPIIDGAKAVNNTDRTPYPSSFIGYRDDGTVAFCTVSSTLDGSREALRLSDGYQFCREMGFNSVFYLDGGGSATFITLEQGSYTVRNKCSDGNVRPVINGIAVVWNDEKVCERQGTLSYIKTFVDLSSIPATYMDGALASEMMTLPYGVNVGYDEEQRAMYMTPSSATNDPYATVDFANLLRASADEYKYVVLKLKNNHPDPETNLTLYYATGGDEGAAADRYVTVPVASGMDEWKYVVVDMSGFANWTGNINTLRLDIFDGLNVDENVTTYFGAIVLCKTAEEADSVKDGWTPEGAITDYLAYLDAMNPKPDPEPDPEPVESSDEKTSEKIEETVAGTEAASESETLTESDPLEEDGSENMTEDTAPESDSNNGGCGSSVGFCAVAVLICAAFAFGRKKD